MPTFVSQVRGRRSRSAAVATLLLATAVAVTLVVLPSAAGGTRGGGALHAYVITTNRGPIRPCAQDLSNCTDANIVRAYLYVANANVPQNVGGDRTTLPNAFVVDRVDLAILVNGVDTFDNYFTPPPNAFSPAASAHWPSTVRCAPTGPPCNVVASPAVLALENLAVFYIGWAHGDGDPNGLYVFRYTVHGTLNGTPVDLVATSLPIPMTS